MLHDLWSCVGSLREDRISRFVPDRPHLACRATYTEFLNTILPLFVME